jgi:DNA-binding winged helix-turn-helix (wHTH) protein
VLSCGDLKIDPAKRQVERSGELVTLTTLEFDALYFMASRAGRVFSREALMNHVWGLDRVVDDRSIDSLISRLRRKLEADPADPHYIQTVWGAGYRFASWTGEPVSLAQPVLDVRGSVPHRAAARHGAAGADHRHGRESAAAQLRARSHGAGRAQGRIGVERSR